MVKVADFQATALDGHVVVVVGPECFCSILKDYLEWMENYVTSLFDLQKKAYEFSWQRSLHTKEPNHNGSKPSFSFQLVRFYLLLFQFLSTPTTWEQILLPRNRDFWLFPPIKERGELSRELFLLENISKSSRQQEEESSSNSSYLKSILLPMVHYLSNQSWTKALSPCPLLVASRYSRIG